MGLQSGLMTANNSGINEDSFVGTTQPRVFRLSQDAGPLPISTLWGSSYEPPATLSCCHAGISQALAGDQPSEFTWWSAMLERHLDQLVGGYMAGCRTAHQWDVAEIVRVHWYSVAIKARLRSARLFPSVWSGAGRSLSALQLIHSS